MTLTVCSDHPLIAHKMSVLRDASTTSQDFRRVLREITFYLGYEATRALKTADVQITTPLATTTGAKLSEHIAIIPVLRSGLGMTEAFLDLLPKAVVHHIGNDKAI